MRSPDERYLLWLTLFTAGLLLTWCGCTVAINFGRHGTAATDSHDADSHDASATNSRAFDVNISPR